MMLAQHIYTSTGRRDFGTVAISPGIDAETRRFLESRVKSFPDGRLWTGDAPPLVVRGFSIPTSNHESIWAVSKLTTAVSRDGREGNFLAHTYLVPHAVLAAQNYNLPWIAACLPFRHDFRPASGYGCDALEPWAGEINPAGQLRMFAYAAREMTVVAFGALIERLVDRACNSDEDQAPFDLDMPAPNPDLPAIFEKIFGAPAPDADEVRLLRLAGALAVLPPAFKRDLTFTVNDLGSRAAGLRVPRGWRAPAPADVAQWPWLDRCLALVAAGEHDALWTLTTWLSRLLPVDCRPSRAALDRGFTFHAQVVAATSDPSRSVTLAQTAGLMDALSHFQVDVSVLHEAVRPCLEHPAAAPSDRFAVYSALAQIAAGTRRSLPVPFVDGLVACLQDEVAGRGRAAQAFLTGLPGAVQGAIWTRAWAEGRPPARIAQARAIPDRSPLAFTVATFDPTRVGDVLLRQRIVTHVADSLAEAGWAMRMVVSDRRLHATVRGLWALTRLDSCATNLLPALADLFARPFVEASCPDRRLLPWFGRAELATVIRSLLFDSGSVAPAALAALAREVARRDAPAARELVFALDLGVHHRARTVQFAVELDRIWDDAEVGLVVGVLRELANLLDHPETLTCTRVNGDPLTWFGVWQHSPASDPPAWSEDLRSRFWQLLAHTVRRTPAVVAFPIAALYLRMTPGERHGMFTLAADAVTRDVAALGAWLGAESPHVRPGRAGFLVWFLEAARERGTRTLDQAVGMVQGILDAVPPTDVGPRVAANLEYALDAARLPGRVRRKLRVPARQW